MVVLLGTKSQYNKYGGGVVIMKPYNQAEAAALYDRYY